MDRRTLKQVCLVLSAACAVAVAAGAAQAGPVFPARKAGLWEIRVQQPAAGLPPLLMQQCVDAATDKALQELGDRQSKMNRNPCKESTRNEVGKLLVHQSVCQDGTGTTTTHTVIGGDFQSEYEVFSQTRYAPPRKDRPDSDGAVKARWLGACTAGQKPGDMVMPGGVRMNVSEILKMTLPSKSIN